MKYDKRTLLFTRPGQPEQWLHRAIGAGMLLACILATLPIYAQPPAREPAGTEDLQTVTISYVPTGTLTSVTVAGTFNRWNKAVNPLRPVSKSVVWQTDLRLAPGVYQYRIVLNGTRWITPAEAARWNDGGGIYNALLLVPAPGFETRKAAVGDGLITASGVYHAPAPVRPASTALGVQYAVRTDKSHIAVTLRTRRQDVERCAVVTPSGGIRAEIPMRRYAQDALFDFWQATVPLPPLGKPLRYAFVLHDGPLARLYDSSGTLSELSPQNQIVEWFTIMPEDLPDFETPEWARDAIFYQIFPDRFANGDPANDPANVQRWGSPPTAFNWMGGDLAGIEQHFDYLKDLGVNALYLNPIFKTRSNHGYDTTDYKKVDGRFGTLTALRLLTKRLHAHNWHIMLDGVFNHTGVDFAGFKSLQTEGEQSRYRDWYFVHGFPVEVKEGQKNYEGWNGTPWMPKLNVTNPETRDFLLGVATYWITEAGIDGWRIDAAQEINHDFLKALRIAVKRARPDAFLVGEIWPGAQDWLKGDEMDSVMNYRWRGAALDFFVFDKTPPSQFDGALGQIRADYPPSATAVMFNMLDSHDVERLRTLCKGDRNRERQAVLFQMTYPGTPCIYYGDEVGMEGGKDPDNRRAMSWDKTKWDKELLGFYKEAIGLRNKHAVLRRGDYQTVVADDLTGVYAFFRTYQNERALVLFNRSDRPQQARLPISVVGTLPFQDWLKAEVKTERQGDNLVVSLPPKGYAVLGH